MTQDHLSLNGEFHTEEQQRYRRTATSWKPDVHYRIYKSTLLDHILPTPNFSRQILTLSLRFRLRFSKDSYLKFLC